MTADGTYQYVWDNQNRLKTLKDSAGQTLADYLYNERSLRLKADTFYIYSFDGRLLAEYNAGGLCVRDYIYSGNRLVAEFRPQESKYYFYMPDQIESVRMVTNDTGEVSFSVTYDPYGGTQKAWVSTYTPALQFGGKERDSESGMNYFGARYFVKRHRRFLSVDPVVNKDEALANPQIWNLYAYCRNNPLTYSDPDGRYEKDVHYQLTYDLAIQVGFSSSDARIIAAANQYVDESPLTSSTHFYEKGHSQRCESWHFPTEQRVKEVLDEAIKTHDLKKLGQALHVLQDSYSHAGYTAPWGHLFDTVSGKKPDKTYRNVDKALEMAQRTLDALGQFRGIEGMKINEDSLRTTFEKRD